MKRYHRAWVVYRKELVETLRDRRTLLAMVLVPLVLYPVLMVVLVEALRTETGRRQADRYRICVPTDSHGQWLASLLASADRRQKAREKERSDAPPDADDHWRSFFPVLHADQVEISVLGPGMSIWDQVADQRFHAGILIDPPPSTERPKDLVNRVVQIIYTDTDPRSQFVYDQLMRIVEAESDRIVKARLARLPNGDKLLNPFIPASLSTASPQQQFAKALAAVVPFLLVIMTVTGAIYPAIDLTAGERERGTLETLAVAPVPTGQIIAGKFGVVVTIAMISTALNLGSMSAMIHFSKIDKLASTLEMGRRTTAESAPAMEKSRPTSSIAGPTQRDYVERRRQLEQQAEKTVGFLTTAAPLVMFALVPFAVLAAAVMLAACSFARTFKEAQNYMMPVMMATLIPAMVVSYMPTLKLEGVLLVIPVANVVVLLRDLFLGHYAPTAIVVCLLSTCLYAAAAVSVAARLYANEAVLFSDVGSYKTLLRRKFFRPAPAPSPAFALLTIAILFPLNFYLQSYLLDAGASRIRFQIVLALDQLLALAAPVLLLAWYAKIDIRETFSLRPPRAVPLIGALLIVVSIAPVTNLLEQVQFRYFPSLRPTGLPMKQLAEWLTEGPLAGVLLVGAVLPGICEELVFRGFLLSALRRKMTVLRTALAVGLMFGLFHIFVEKIPIVTIIGVVLALVCLRCESIFPAMLVHMANNGLALAATRLDSLRSFFAIAPDDAGAIQVSPRLATFITAFAFGLVLMLFSPRRSAAEPGPPLDSPLARR